ncbi:hypothetical protein HpKG70_03540 [Helicobacter pylori]
MVFFSMFSSLGTRIIFIVLAALLGLGGAFYWFCKGYAKRCVNATHGAFRNRAIQKA